MEEEIFAPAPTGEGTESLTGGGGDSAGAENLAGPDGTEFEAGGQSLPQERGESLPRESGEAEGRGRGLPPQGVEAGMLPPQGGGAGALPPQGGGGLLEALRADKELGELALKVALANLAAKAGPGKNSGPSAEVADYGSRLDEIRRLDPSVTGWGDIAAADTDRAYYRLVFEKGLDEVSAYKAVFFDRLLKGRAEAARQQALNEARSKTHLAPVGGGEGRGAEMTAAELEEWAAYGFGPAEARRYKTRFEKER